MRKPVLVTGANGFIGQHLVRGLVDAGYPVRAFVRRSDSGNFPEGVRICKGDVRFANTLEKAVSGCGAVFHLAARMGGKDIEDYREVNVHGSALVAEAVAKHGDEGRLVFMSSISAMGPRAGQTEGPRVESDMNPALKPYGISKWEAEQKLREVCARHAVGLDILRPGLVFGPEDPGWMPALINDVAEGRIHRMGSGQNRLGLVYVDHLVAECVALLQHTPSSDVFISVDPN
ncbi:MAG: NAD-dependent epimerase/dehydratase family protein, partial [Anaerolineae bacterium]